MWGLGQSGLEEKVGELEQKNRDLEKRIYELETPSRRDANIREVLQRLGLIHFSVDLEDRLIDWNAVSQRQLGWTREDVEGRNMYEFLVADLLKPQIQQGVQLAKSKGESVSLEFSAWKPDGSLIFLSLRGIPMFQDGSKICEEILFVGQDITERKRYEQEMVRKAQELKSFIDTVNAPIFGTDVSYNINEWNDQAEEVSGFRRNEVLGKNFIEFFIAQENQNAVRDLLNDALNGNNRTNFELPLLDAKKQRLLVLLNVTARRNINGEVIGIMGVGQDITDRKRYQDERARVAQELQNFIDTANAPIFGIDHMGLVNEWNLKAAEITQFSREEVIGKNLVEIYITDEFRSSVKLVLDNALKGFEAANFEFALYSKDHRRVDVLLNATPRRDVAGNVIGVIGVGQDITERKMAEMEKARVALELQTFIDTANAPIFGIDDQGLVNEWNMKAAELTGFSKQEVLGQNLVEVYISEKFRNTVNGVLQNALCGMQTSNIEFPMYTKEDKRRVEVLVNATARRDITGNIIGVIAVGQDITERKRVEGEKTRVAKELQTFIDTANAPIFGIDAKGLVNEWNNKSAEITGFSREEVLGQNLVEVYISEEFRQSVREVLVNALQQKATANFEFPLYTKDKRRVDVLLNATPRLDANGNVVGVIGVGQDITARKLFEEEKTRVAKELQTFIDTANAPIFGIDAKGLVNEWNNKAAEITGFSKDQVLNRNLVEDFISPDYRVSVSQVLTNALKGRGTANFEFPLFTVDKRRVEVLLNATPRKDISGQVVGVIGVGQDITDRKQVEVEKTRVAEELQNFIDTANAPIFGIDANGLVNEWNNKAAEITGFSKEEVLGKDLVEVYITDEYRSSVKEVLDNALQGHETANFEFPLFTKNQRRVEVLLNATTRRDESGKAVGVIGVGQDITERKQVESEKFRVAQELQAFIDSANAPIFGIDAKGRINEWNNKAAEITNFSSMEVLGRELVKDFITEEYRETVKEVLDNALRGLEASNFEFPLYTKDQRRVEVLLNATTRRDVSGRVVGVLGVGQDITERKRVEIEMTRIARELQTFIDTANAPIFGIDANGLVNEWNNKSAEITGYSKAEVLGKNLVEVYITEEFRASVKEVLDKALKGAETANFEFPLFTKDMRRVDVLLNATTRLGDGGRVVGVIGVGQDITERKRAEEEKTRVAKELQNFIDTANAPIFGIDADGLVNEWNNKAAEITGFSSEEVLGRNLVQDFITEEYRVTVKEVLDNALQGIETSDFEFPLYTVDKRRVEVLLNATSRRNTAGKIVGVIGVGQDITERKRVEEEKARVAQELQTFIDTANAPIFGIDADGLVNEWNNKAAEITGFSREQVIGRSLVKDFITEEYRVSVRDVLDKALKGVGTANFEFPLYTVDGQRVEVLLNATTRRDAHGNVTGVVGVGQDITDIKRSQEEMTRVANELQTFIDTANAPIFGIDAKGLVNEWNNKAAEITGFSREEVLGQDLVEVYISEEFRQSVRKICDLALQKVATANFEFPLYTKDKRRVDVLLNATPRLDTNGDVVGVIGVGQDITARKLFEEEKTRVAKELQTFIDTANAPIFGIDDKGLVNEWNNKAAEITGFSREEVLGQNLVEVYISADFRSTVSEVLENALKGRGTANFEFPLYTKDGRRVEVLLNATPRRNMARQVVGVIGVGQDITERKEVEIEKTRVAQELQTFIDTANAPIFGIDDKGLINEWNNKSAEITGFSRQMVFGQNLVEKYITEEYREQVKMVLDNALEGEETANFEFPLFTKSGRRVDVLLNATTRRDVTGRPIGVIGVGQDITERKQVEEEKTRVAQELQTFIDTANAPIFGIDANGLVNEWNNKAAEITGYSKAEVLGKNLVEVYITQEFRPSVKKVLDDALLGREKSNFEFPLFTKDKRRVEVLLNATTRRDVTGAIVGVIGVGQDITEMRRLMEQEALLFQAQAANDAKSQFLATMSHEMRTPLNVIMGMNDLILETSLLDEQRKFAEQIKSSSESLLVLINDILDLTKIEAGKLELVSVDFDLRQVIEDTVDSVASKALGKGLEICCYMSPNTPTVVNGDPDRLRQILLNLLSNGIKFTNVGQVYLLAEMEEETPTHHMFRFKVYDSGIGISEEGQKKLFNRFSQVDSSTTRTYGGTGLGLAISKQFAELMNGSMGVQSNLGKGSLFWFSAVFKKVNTAVQPIYSLPSAVHSKRILLVADNETLRNAILRYLETFGIIPRSVEGVLMAIPYLKERSVDIVIICPSVQQQRSPMPDENNPDEEPITDDLKSCMKVVTQYAQERSDMQSIVFCPITQLSQAAVYRNVPGCIMLSRPGRLSALHAALKQCTSPPEQNPHASIDRGETVELAEVEDEIMGGGMARIPSMRILIAMQLEQQHVLRAMLVRESHTCDLCNSFNEVMAMLRNGEDTFSHFSHDCVILDYELLGSKTSQVAKEIQGYIRRSTSGKRPILIGIVNGFEGQEYQECSQAGMDGLITRPFDRMKVKEAIAKAATHSETTRDPSLNAGSSQQHGCKSSRAVDASDLDRKQRILVVDDDAGQRRVLRAMLTKDGFEVDTAEDGSQAVKAVQKVKYDAVLMDGFMPNKTGWEATAEIRSREKETGSRRPITIIGVTGASGDDEKKCKEAGMTDTILKPISRDKLTAKIREWISKAEALRCDSPDPSSTPPPSAKEPPRPAAGSSQLRVLVVDDDAGHRMMLRAMLARDKHQVDTVDNGAEAVKKAAKVSYDVILLDGFMPHMSGWDACKEMRACEAASAHSAVILGIIGPNPSDDEPKFKEAGVSDLICKPVSKDKLAAKIAEALSRGKTTVCESPPAAEKREEVVRGKPKVLVVDRDIGQRKVLKAILSRLDCEMAELSKSSDCLDKLQAEKFDMLMITSDMPSPSGWDIARELRQGRSSTMPIVALMSAEQAKEFEEKNKDKLFSGFACKPYDKGAIEALVQTINKSDKQPPSAAERSVATTPPPAPAGGVQPKKESKAARILIVEDHWANRKLLEAMLLQKGHELHCVENGVEAVNITAVVEFDLVLMDCNMPIMDGWQATEKIRQRAGLNQTTPIIAVTANAMKGDRDKCIAAGMDDYISKPVERKRLYEIIAKWTTTVPDVAVASTSMPQQTNQVAAAPPPSAPAALPVERTRSPAIRRANSNVGKKEAPESKPTILLVDDDNTLRLLVKSRLEKDNSRVIDAGDGEEALEKFHKSRPDIVISDVFMPKMDGFELCRQIRKHDKRVPIVMLTSMNDVKDRIKGLDAGADDYIVKPFAPKELEARVRSLLRRREASGGEKGEASASSAGGGGGASAENTTVSIETDVTGGAEVVSKVRELDSLLGMLKQQLKL